MKTARGRKACSLSSAHPNVCKLTDVINCCPRLIYFLYLSFQVFLCYVRRRWLNFWRCFTQYKFSFRGPCGKCCVMSLKLSFSYYLFRFQQNPCSSSPCLNRGTCQVGFTSKGFRCLCVPGYAGANCSGTVKSSWRYTCHELTTTLYLPKKYCQ